ncbi:MAG: hypothetical protein CHACPFDD_02625 [Phycisphaerae bacterium]|nr:hypothetical protein [Phycisphaerae bacterium]
MNKRDLILGVIGILAIGGAIWMFVAKPGAPKPFPDTLNFDGICLKCRQDVSASAKREQRAPWECPTCKERSVYPWMFCHGCKKLFIPRLEAASDGGPPKMPVVPVCTGCGGSRTGSYYPDDPEQQDVAGRVDLPKWP